MTSFVHLRLHTEYSLIDSVVRVPELMEAVAAAGMPAIALTDECNLFALVKFYREAQAKGVKPLIGVDFRLREANDRKGGAEGLEFSRITLFCQNLQGYRNLTQLVTRAYLEGQRRDVPLLERAWLTPETTLGLLALSNAQEGDIGRALLKDRPVEARQALDRWLALFDGRFYIELQRIGRAGEEDYIGAVLPLAAQCRVPVVATNEVRFLTREDFESHEARVCIHEGTLLVDNSRARRYTEQQYLRSPEEMALLFSDIPEALQNAVEIARRCSLELNLGESKLPEYPVPAGFTTETFLREESRKGLDERLSVARSFVAAHAPVAGKAAALSREDYDNRLVTELDVICKMGFAGYFLIVADFIRWSRENGIPVGPGRGSGAGSVVAWCLRITDLDPLEHDLLFERFLNPERVSMPDFDVDFCMEGRDRVIDYVSQKYGRDRVSQIITYGTMAAKAVVRDVGRVLGMSYGYVDKIAKLIPFELEITLDAALEKEPELRRLYNAEEEVKNLIDRARSLEGLTRNAGKHAGGVVISPSKLTDFTPLYCEEGAAGTVTQFDKDDVEAAGLVKFDFLGLRTLTIIDWAVKVIVGAGGTVDFTRLTMDDPAAYELLKKCKTNAVFQLESRGMKDLIRRLQPDRFEDIVALVALFRPGPLQSGMVDDFIARKHDKTGTVIDYLHPELKPVLEATYGVILYQEQVMQIAQVLAGYTLGGADLLRRAMGKKKPEEMAKQRSIFVSGAVARGVLESQAAHIFDLMEKFAGYGFNKSHSAAYAVLSYQTAWLKAHHTAAFMAAVLSSDMDKTDKVVKSFRECGMLGIKVDPPDVNTSVYPFAMSGKSAIRYGLGAVKGVGQAAAEAITVEREANGPYLSLQDFCRRLDLNRVNKRAIEALIRSGSFDSLRITRRTLMARLGTAMQFSEQNTRAMSTGQVDFFGLAAPSALATEKAETARAEPELSEWPEDTLLAGERDTLGLYLSGHPITRYEQELSFLTNGSIADIANAPRSPAAGESGRWQQPKTVTAGGLVFDIRKGKNATTVMLDDASGRIEVALFEDVYQQYRSVVVKDAILLVEGRLRFDEVADMWRITAQKLTELSTVREQKARRLFIKWPRALTGSEAANKLADILKPYAGGGCSVWIKYENDLGSGVVALDEQWTVRPAAALIERLSDFVGRDNLRLLYGTKGMGSSAASAGNARGH